MKKTTKISIVAAVILIVIGAAIFIGTMSTLDWNFRDLSTQQFKTNTHENITPITNITVETDSADITFALNTNNATKVVCHELEKVTHTVSFENGNLLIREMDIRKWFDHIGINFERTKITIYLPKDNFGALDIHCSTGDILIPENFIFESMNISTSTGDIETGANVSGPIRIKTDTGDICVQNAAPRSMDLTASTGKVTVSDVTCFSDMHIDVTTGKVNLYNVNCKNLYSAGSTGSFTASNLLSGNQLVVNRSTGNVTLTNCDATAISIRTTTGDITGSLLTGKIFSAEVGTGKVSLPDNSPGGTCVLVTSTGDIKFTAG